MKITKLTIKNFRKFKDKTFEFSDGVNVVQGLNEAGKSTLSEAILTLLFADPTTKSKQFFDRYGSWDESGSIFLQAEGTSPLGKFQLTKDFGLKLAKLTNLDTKKETNDIKGVEASIGQLLGIKSVKVFESSAFVSQSDLARIESSEDLVASIQSAASAGGVEEGVGTVIKEIDRELAELKKGLDRPTNSPGKLKELEVKISETMQNLEDKKQKWEKVKSAANEGKSSKGELESVTEKISLVEKQIEYNRKFKEGSQKIKEIEQQIVRLERKMSEVSEISTQISNIRSQIENFKPLDSIDLEKTAKEVNELTGSIRAKKETIAKLEREEIVEAEKPDNPVFPRLLVPLFFLVVTIVLYILLSRLDILLTGLGITFVIGAYMFFNSQKGSAGKEGRKEVEMREKQLKEIIEQIGKESACLEKKFEEIKVRDSDEFYTKKAKLRGFLEERANLESLQKGMLEGKSLEQIKGEQAELFAKKKEVEVNELTEDVRNSNLTSEEYLRKRRELDTLKMEEKRLSELETASKVRVQDAEISIDDVVEEEELLERLNEEYSYYKKKRKVLELVRETIDQSIEGTAKDAGKIIKEFVKMYLARLTQDRYSDVKIEKNLSIQVFSKEKGDWIDPVSVLSKGTVDQIYFLTRLAILDLVAKDSNPPIILDDPFVTFDETRKETTKEILKEIGEKHQVILLTHHEEYNDWGNSVVI
ncbi:AAA family ATPase [Candidatus Dojkabacteria bacterium]|nr:AAA family ATPase [Candidatus Dojkabacteria bacterium]